ncbi:AAA family ATPase [Clostridium sp.]|uniref:AAA family ATPase n=1 Tax=Clostridium sp. TaxID=1506 RepID=UPI00263682AD|nr:AAA family ATPase [Clostridium sp.]
MIIDKINIIAFAGIKNKVIDFNLGNNIVYGENEKGKSTIESFIRVFLYGMNSKRSKDIKSNDRLRFIPLDGDKIKGELYINHKGRKYIIRRSFGETKKQDLSEVIDGETGEEILEVPKENPGKYFLNVNSSTFNKTLFISQLGVSIIKDKEEEIIDRAANLIDDGEDNISADKAINKLEVIKKIIKTPRKNGELDLLKERYEKLLEEKQEGYKLSEENIDKEQDLINSKGVRDDLRKEIRNLSIYKKYMKKTKLQKEYEEITEYLKKKEELEKRERFIEESIVSKNGVIDERLINDIKEENSIYFSLLDMKTEEEKALYLIMEEYENKKKENHEILLLEMVTSEEKNRYMKSLIEEEVIKEKIRSYNIIEKDINNIKEEINLKEKELEESINFDGIREEIKLLLASYEDKLKELKFSMENVSVDKPKKYKNNIFDITLIILSLTLILLGFLFEEFSKYLIPLGGVVLVISLLNIILKVNKKESYNNKNYKLENLKGEIESIEEVIYKYTEAVGAKSYEDFIRKLRLYDEFKIYQEKQIIKLREKEIQLENFNHVKIEEDYLKNQKNIDNILGILNTNNKEEVMYILSKYDEIQRDILSLKINIEKEENNLINKEKELKIREDRIREKLNCLGLEDIDLYSLEERLFEIKEKIKEREEIINGLKMVEETYNVLTKGKDIEFIKSEIKEIINENINYSYSSEEEIDKQISIKSNELIEIEKNIKDLENHISNRFIGKRLITEIEEEIEEVKNKINKLEIKLKALDLAIENMKESKREIRGNFSNILNERVIKDFKELTNNLYEEVMVSENYEMKVRREGDIFKDSLLSNGASDQLYLALRLAFIKMIFKKEEVPVILDDAFVQYDDKRLNSALDLLTNYNFKQLIIFTCQNREKEGFINKDIDFNYISL